MEAYLSKANMVATLDHLPSFLLVVAMIHHKRRVDENQKEIFSQLREIGVVILNLSSAGEGIPDALWAYRNKKWLVEIKNPTKPKKDQELTPAQVQTHKRLADVGVHVYVIRTIGEAIRLVTGLDP